MLSLIKKDLRMHFIPINIALYIGLMVVEMIIFANDAGGFYFAAGYVGLAGSISIFGYDEKSKFHIIMNSLPVNRSMIVGARYMSGLIFTGIAILVSTILTIAFNFGSGEVIYGMTVLTKILVPYFILTALAYPLNYLLSYRITRFVSAIFYVLYFVIVMGLFNAGSQIALTGIATPIFKYGWAVGLSMWIISIPISMLIYARKYR